MFDEEFCQIFATNRSPVLLFGFRLSDAKLESRLRSSDGDGKDVVLVSVTVCRAFCNVIIADRVIFAFLQLCVFAEGTRYTKEKHEANLIYARENGLPELKHLLLPRTKGFTFLMKQLKDSSNE